MSPMKRGYRTEVRRDATTDRPTTTARATEGHDAE
ncbi:hypothetical protein HTG_07970 [Natrinema mahii]|nr:hypothetical protein HTG_07970 [Natrinema mahii]